MRKGGLLAMLILSTFMAAACGGSPQPAASTATGLPQGEPVQMAKGTYFNIDVNQVKPLLEDESVFTVNVHIPYAGDIPGTDASIPFNEVAQQVDALPADKDAPIVVYCRSGSMSAEASETLVGLGYTEVLNLTGGMNAWQRAGNELVQR
jgi:rhodanese-related sulfurtransferase